MDSLQRDGRSGTTRGVRSREVDGCLQSCSGGCGEVVYCLQNICSLSQIGATDAAHDAPDRGDSPSMPTGKTGRSSTRAGPSAASMRRLQHACRSPLVLVDHDFTQPEGRTSSRAGRRRCSTRRRPNFNAAEEPARSSAISAPRARSGMRARSANWQPMAIIATANAKRSPGSPRRDRPATTSRPADRQPVE